MDSTCQAMEYIYIYLFFLLSFFETPRSQALFVENLFTNYRALAQFQKAIKNLDPVVGSKRRYCTNTYSQGTSLASREFNE